jgi:hypothetical protein
VGESKKLELPCNVLVRNTVEVMINPMRLKVIIFFLWVAKDRSRLAEAAVTPNMSPVDSGPNELMKGSTKRHPRLAPTRSAKYSLLATPA